MQIIWGICYMTWKELHSGKIRPQRLCITYVALSPGSRVDFTLKSLALFSRDLTYVIVTARKTVVLLYLLLM